MYLNDQIKEDLKPIFDNLLNSVKIIYFTQTIECQFCRETKDILNEVAELSDKIDFSIHNFIHDEELVKKYKIERIPATVILDKSEKDFGIRFYGIPSGYEFSTLIEVIKMVSSGKTGLSVDLEEKIKTINSDVDLQVFVTPTCPHCPKAVISAFKMAYLNDNIKAVMIEATEFPDLAYRFNVRGVPRTVINEKDFIEGAAPENILFDKILKNLKERKNK